MRASTTASRSRPESPYGENTDSSGDDFANFGCVDNDNGAHCQEVGGSISILHEESGLYTNFAAGWFQDDDVASNSDFAGVNADDETTFWAVEGGIHKKWIDLGPTTIFGQYYSLDGGANARQSVGAGDAINSIGAAARIFTSDVEMFGVGIAQDIKAAEIKLYTLYRHYEADVSLVAIGGAVVQDSEPLEDLDVLMSGAIIKF